MSRLLISACLAVALLAALACKSSGAGGREVSVTQGDEGCTPSVIEATPGEKLDLRVKNETGNSYEMEGIDGTELEEILIPEGRTRSIGFNVPKEGGVSKVKCYVPGGASTIIEVRAGEGEVGDSTDAPNSEGRAGDPEADTIVSVGLNDYRVTPDVNTVSAGTVRFEATNESSSMVHELAVLKIEGDGSLGNKGELENIGPGGEESLTVDLEAGRYQLACLLIPGESGSTVDHYKAGMWVEFTVE